MKADRLDKTSIPTRDRIPSNVLVSQTKSSKNVMHLPLIDSDGTIRPECGITKQGGPWNVKDPEALKPFWDECERCDWTRVLDTAAGVTYHDVR